MGQLTEDINNKNVERATVEMMLLQIMGDMIDMQIVEALDARDRCGIREMDKAAMIERNRVLKNLSFASKKYISWASVKERKLIQEPIGMLSDMTRSILLLILDRSKENKDLWYIYNDIETRFKSKRNLDMSSVKRCAFSEVLSEL